MKAIIVEKESEFQINVFGQLSITQLDTLLKWHGMVKDKENNNGKEHKTVKWHRIREERAQPPAFERWTLENELKLMELKKMIGMSEKVTCQLEKRKKGEVVLARIKLNCNEREHLE